MSRNRRALFEAFGVGFFNSARTAKKIKTSAMLKIITKQPTNIIYIIFDSPPCNIISRQLCSCHGNYALARLAHMQPNIPLANLALLLSDFPDSSGLTSNAVLSSSMLDPSSPPEGPSLVSSPFSLSAET